MLNKSPLRDLKFQMDPQSKWRLHMDIKIEYPQLEGGSVHITR